MATRGRKPTEDSAAGEAIVSLQAGPAELALHDQWEIRWGMRQRSTIMLARQCLLRGEVARADALLAAALHDLDGWERRDRVENATHVELREAAGVVIRDCRMRRELVGGAA